jgi:hypothetical protein
VVQDALKLVFTKFAEFQSAHQVHKLVGQKAPFKLKEIWAIRVRLQLFRRARDLALFDLVSTASCALAISSG